MRAYMFAGPSPIEVTHEVHGADKTGGRFGVLKIEENRRGLYSGEFYLHVDRSADLFELIEHASALAAELRAAERAEQAELEPTALVEAA